MEHPPNIVDLPRRVAGLARPDRERFERILEVRLTRGLAVPPEAMHAWIAQQFGSVEAIRRQDIVRVTNKVTGQGALFNGLRARRPQEVPAGEGDAYETLLHIAGCPFCHPSEGTPADTFGRIRGRYCTTASNVAKYDGWHAVVVFDEHDPLRFTLDQVEDYVHTAQEWAQAVRSHDPDARYPFFMWNCLWRSGSSIVHGHAQVTVAEGMHYARVEACRQSAVRYRAAHGSDYFSDLVTVYSHAGLALTHGNATIFPSLTPAKDKETHIVSPRLEGGLVPALYRVLRAFIDRLGVQSFNVALYQPPLPGTPEDWTGFPFLVHILDRGSLGSRTSDIGAMELYAQSVVATDPYDLVAALRAEVEPPRQHAAARPGEDAP